ncbi:class I SAM-dependent DNA methyltransferase [Streptomyces minutiscleroticus]|uniref:class I SAM-dependent DNA methyltransferase n=1 Tax=Streptomyces minutiscleroticus TaxID=68238 RepID=UPI00167E850E|nr:class I SAM-dependent methyltransferase [Streptomyces minutiscleroticus]
MRGHDRADSVRTTRSSYDAVAERYAELSAGSLAAAPLDRALPAAFADLVRADGAGPVVDVGCGPGQVTARLRTLGLMATGVDLSPAMIDLARAAHPDLRFTVGSTTALDVADGALGGVLARYSLIHTPPERLPEAFAEFRRVLAPGGRLLLAFPALDDPDGVAEAFDHKVALAHRFSPDHVARLLRDAGFEETARLLRAPEEGERGFPQAHLPARRADG